MAAARKATTRLPRKLALDAFREQAVEAQSQIASLVLEMPNGEEFTIPHPMLVSDEAQRRLEAVQAGDDLDRDENGAILDPPRINGKPAEPLAIRTARALMGDEEHARFVAAGGHSNDVTLAWQMLVREQEALQAADPK